MILEAVASGEAEEFWWWLVEGRVPPCSILATLAQVGENDRFFQFVDQVVGWILECSNDTFCRNLSSLLADPLLRPMHEDPRWEEIVLLRVGLSEWPG